MPHALTLKRACHKRRSRVIVIVIVIAIVIVIVIVTVIFPLKGSPP